MSDQVMNGTVQLHHGGASATVLLRGAELVSYKDDTGREYIWQGDPAVWSQHAPVLFPICGHALHDEIIVDGHSYPMPAHGFACHSDFAVYRLGDDFVDLLLESNDETRKIYPFDFALHVIYTISSHGYTTAFVVDNRSEKTLPFCIGGHPGLNITFDDSSDCPCRVDFAEPVSPDIDIVIEGGYIDGKERLNAIQGGTRLPLTHEMVAVRDTLLFSNIACRSVLLTDSNNDVSLHMDLGRFPNLAIWTSGSKYANYVCLEPWHGLPASPGESGVMAEKPGVILLEPGKTFQDAFTVTRVK